MHMFRILAFAMKAMAPVVALGSATAAPPPTEAERSGFERTGRYAEVERLCPAWQRAHPQAVRCVRFGTTPEGRPMLALVVSRSGALDPAQARARALPVWFAVGGIHAGEIDGKDAGFRLLRDLLEPPAADAPPAARAAAARHARALERQVLVFVPVFNVDGHERFAAWNRPNQRGPRETGWRTTAQNFNLNRDFAKADTPEMRAMLALVDAWDPLLFADLHVTDGAQFEHDLSLQVEPGHAGDEALRPLGRALRDGVIDDLRAAGALPQPFYMSFAIEDDPSSGFVDSVPPPRFSHGYFLLRNRFGMLVEMHSWRPYAHRVQRTREVLQSIARRLADDGAALRSAVQAADARTARTLAGGREALSWKATDDARTIDFRGVAYTRTPSPLSGATMTRYDEATPQVWRVPLRDRMAPATEAVVPRAGYVVPAEHARDAAGWLRTHGVRFETLRHDWPQAQVDAWRATSVKPATRSTEGRQRFAVAGRWAPETVDVRAGALFVPTAQPKARLVVALLEPEAPDGWVAWGRFANAFEPKEYVEPYVAEAFAAEMLAADPALKADFEQRLATDPAFAADPAARLRFFAQRHPSWDTRLNRVPLWRVDARPPRREGTRPRTAVTSAS